VVCPRVFFIPSYAHDGLQYRRRLSRVRKAIEQFRQLISSGKRRLFSWQRGPQYSCLALAAVNSLPQILHGGRLKVRFRRAG